MKWFSLLWIAILLTAFRVGWLIPEVSRTFKTCAPDTGMYLIQFSGLSLLLLVLLILVRPHN